MKNTEGRHNKSLRYFLSIFVLLMTIAPSRLVLLIGMYDMRRVDREGRIGRRSGREWGLVHLSDELVNVGLSVTVVTTLNVVLEFA
jgi:hypothetical protein